MAVNKKEIGWGESETKKLIKADKDKLKLILLVGACGSGKTWVAKQLISKWNCNAVGRIGLVLYHRSKTNMVVGKYDDTVFEGSDKLSMAVMKDFGKFLEGAKNFGVKKIMLEGDRFTNSTVMAYHPLVVKIADDGAKGRKLRKSNQSDRQIKSIATRVSNVSATVEVLNSNEALNYITNAKN